MPAACNETNAPIPAASMLSTAENLEKHFVPAAEPPHAEGWSHDPAQFSTHNEEALLLANSSTIVNIFYLSCFHVLGS